VTADLTSTGDTIDVQVTLPWDGTLAGNSTTISGLGDDLAPSARPVALALVVPDRPGPRAEVASLTLAPAATPQLAHLMSLLEGLL
jgi:hypothetical protein